MTDRVIEVMLKESRPLDIVSPVIVNSMYFKTKLRNATEWKRISRAKSDKAGIWKRTYYSKLFGKDGPGLTILTNKGSKDKQEDMYIEYVTITYGKNVIGGGKVSIPSIKLSQLGRKATIQDFQTQSVFAEFTEKELARLSAEMEFGQDSMLDLLESERFA